MISDINELIIDGACGDSAAILSLADMYLRRDDQRSQLAAMCMLEYLYDKEHELFLDGCKSSIVEVASRLKQIHQLKGNDITAKRYEAVERYESMRRDAVAAESLDEELQASEGPIPQAIYQAISKDHLTRFAVTECDEGLSITAKRVARTNETMLPYIEVVIPSRGFATLCEEVREVATGVRWYEVCSGAQSFLADSLIARDGCVKFYLLGELVASIQASSYRYRFDNLFVDYRNE